MPNPLIFIDVDGVLNEFHADFDPAREHVWFKPSCVAELNRICEACNPSVVISSTWRGLVHEKAMTLRGFGYMLMTHGFRCHARIVGITTWEGGLQDRGLQCRKWLREAEGVRRFVAIDDMDLGFALWGIPLVQTDGSVGLTAEDADRVIAILKGV